MKAKIDLIDTAIKSSDKAILKYNPVKHNHNLQLEIQAIKAKEIVPGEATYLKFLNDVDSKQVDYVVSDMNDWKKSLIERDEFMARIEPELNNILNNAKPSLEEHMQGFYNAGKEVGYKEMKVKSFFGKSDENALYTIKNYNFDLINTKSQEFRNKVRQEVWRGTARGDNIETIAKAIRQEPVAPIYNPYYKAPMNQETRSILIARTESMRAMNQGTLLSYQQGGIEQVEVLDSGTEGDFNCDCPDIVAGSPYYIDDNLPELPSHPNCTHSYSPYGMPNVDGLMDVDSYVNLILDPENVTVVAV